MTEEGELGIAEEIGFREPKKDKRKYFEKSTIKRKERQEW